MSTQGFSAFQNAQGASGFMGAVGQTMAAGGQTMANTVLGGGSAAGTSGSAGTGGSISRMIGQQGTQAVTRGLAAQAGTQAGAGNVVTGLLKGLGNWAKTDQGSAIVASAISSGIQSYMAARQYEKEEKKLARRNFFGGPMRGGDAELNTPVPSIPFGINASFGAQQGQPGPQTNVQGNRISDMSPFIPGQQAPMQPVQQAQPAGGFING